MTCYAVIDTNVLVSALLSSHSNASTVQVVGKIFSAEVIPLFSRSILEEYREVLCRKKFHFSEETVATLIDTVERTGKLIEPESFGETLIDMKDLPFYEVVLSKQDEGAYLVTGNLKHFPSKPFIVTANELLEILSRPNKETVEALLEAERIVHDSSVKKYTDVEEALSKLKG